MRNSEKYARCFFTAAAIATEVAFFNRITTGMMKEERSYVDGTREFTNCSNTEAALMMLPNLVFDFFAIKNGSEAFANFLDHIQQALFFSEDDFRINIFNL